MSGYEKPFAERVEWFWCRVERGEPDACWEWTGSKNNKGYGRMGFYHGSRYAHRFSYQIAYGLPPRCVEVLHTCDNRGCVNPAHLRLGTHAENMADMKAKGRGAGLSRPGEANPQSKLTDEIVRQIRLSYAAGGVSIRELSLRHGVARSLIFRIIHRQAWQHVE
jgi:hypothetical protein